jgi:hypothetical protein
MKKAIKYIDVDGNTVTRIRIGSTIRKGLVKGKVVAKEVIPQPFFDSYRFTLDTGEMIKCIKSLL